MHILCLISAQPMPNYLPLHTLKPKAITLAVTPEMKQRAQTFAQVCCNHGLPAPELLDLPAATELPSLLEVFTSWVAQHEAEDLVLNATGGTKLMAIAAQEVFRMAGKPLFYVDAQTDRLLWLTDREAPPERQGEVSLKTPTIQTVLELNGYVIEEQSARSETPSTWQTFAETVAEHITKWRQALVTLNAIASEAEARNTLNANHLFNADPRPAAWDALFAALQQSYLLASGKDFTFASPAARDFARGGWLELYTFRCLKELHIPKERCLMNVVLRAQNSQMRNELDVVLLHRNELYILECKARNFRQKKGDTRVDNALYKVAHLASQQGLKAKGALVSIASLGKLDRERANLLQVKVFDNLPQLKQALATAFLPPPATP